MRLAELAADRTNPIVIKEVRQAVRSRSYVGLYMLLLAACVVISILACGAYLRSDNPNVALGGDAFGAFLACLGIAGIILMPLMAFHSLGLERIENTYELLNVSGLSAGKIVRGKLGANLLLLSLIYSAFVPFMAFTYLLRGIDLVQMLFLIAAAFVLSVFIIMTAITVSTLAQTRKSFVISWVGFFLFILGVGAYLIIGGLIMLFEWRSGLTELMEASGYIGAVLASYFVVLYLIAVSSLSPASANRSTALRVALLAQTVLFLGLVHLGTRSSAYVDPDIWLGFGTAILVQWAIVGACVTTEPDGLSRRVALSVPRTLFTRFLVGALWPGRRRGWAYLTMGVALVLAVTYARGAGASPYGRYHSTRQEWAIPLLLACDIYVYLGLIDLLFSTVLRRWRAPTLERVGAVVVLGVGAVLPLLIEALAGMEPGSSAWLHSLNPFAVGLLVESPDLAPLVVPVLAGAACLAAHVPAMIQGYIELDSAARANRRRAARAAAEPQPSSQ